MPRPRRDSEVLHARERMENAFWELLAERDYHKITVTDIVREAGVNRNSFYYHYSGLPELADFAILHQVESEPLIYIAPDSSADPHELWEQRVTKLLADPEQRQRIDRLAMVAGPHSSPELAESLRDFARLQILNALDLDANHLDLKTDLMLEFTIGGTLSILRRWPDLSDTIEIKDLLKEDVAILAMGTYLTLSNEDLTDFCNRIFASGIPHAFAHHHAQDQTDHAA